MISFNNTSNAFEATGIWSILFNELSFDYDFANVHIANTKRI